MNSQRKNDLALLNELIAQCRVYVKNLKKKGMQNDPLYLDLKERKQGLQNAVQYIHDLSHRCPASLRRKGKTA